MTSDTNGSVTLPVAITGRARTPIPVVAQAGPDQNASVGQVVTLDGRASISAATYAWTQVVAPGDPTLTLAAAGTVQPSFTFPLFKAPANNGLLRFKLQITSPDGSSSSAAVTVTPSADTVAIAKALYTASKKEWRVDGNQLRCRCRFVTVHVGGLTAATRPRPLTTGGAFVVC